jgi:hypothetical protein
MAAPLFRSPMTGEESPSRKVSRSSSALLAGTQPPRVREWAGPQSGRRRGRLHSARIEMADNVPGLEFDFPRRQLSAQHGARLLGLRLQCTGRNQPSRISSAIPVHPCGGS